MYRQYRFVCTTHLFKDRRSRRHCHWQARECSVLCMLAQPAASALTQLRAGAVALTKVKKKDREWKGALIGKAQGMCAKYSCIYVFRHRNMRNDVFKELREVRHAAQRAPTALAVQPQAH
jgi:hypothetical protein